MNNTEQFHLLPFPEPFDEMAHGQQLVFIRAHRNMLLQACDWTQIADSPVNKTAWATYRQALRDMPASWVHGTPITFPEPPSGE